MALNIKSAEADRLARELAAATGESITTAVSTALRERLARVEQRPNSGKELELKAIWERASRLQPLTSATDEELLGYDGSGVFD